MHPAKELLLSNIMLQVAEKSLQVLMDEAFRKAVSFKMPSRPPKQQVSARPKLSTSYQLEPSTGSRTLARKEVP